MREKVSIFCLLPRGQDRDIPRVKGSNIGRPIFLPLPLKRPNKGNDRQPLHKEIKKKKSRIVLTIRSLI